MSTKSAVEVPRRVDRAQYVLAAFLAVAGGYILIDAARLNSGFADQSVPPAAFGYLVGAVLLVLAVVLAVVTSRGNIAEGEEGEDIDLTQSADWVTVTKLAGVFAIAVATISWLGWAVVGGFLFAASARILGSRRLLLDIIVGFAMSILTWYGFYVGLGIPIPAGMLEGVL